MNSLSKANTIEDVIRLIHPNILNQIPQNILNIIAQNILDVERYFRGELFLRPGDFTASRIYNPIADEITQIDYQDTSYKL